MKLKRAFVTKASLLIVDDDQDLLHVVGDLLRMEGYHVVTATSGEDALALVERLAPDLIITDMMMPNMDGVELLKQMAADGRYRHVPAIALTAAGVAQARDRLAEAGLQVTVCEKPVRVDQFLLVLAERLEQARQRKPDLRLVPSNDG
jgi:CheY-like chemotaxis protein